MTNPRSRPMLRTWFLVLAAVLPGAACAAAGGAGGGGEEAEESGAPKLEELEKKLDLARMELELTSLEGEQELAQAEQELAGARLEAESARLERESFSTLGRQRELDEALLDLDRSRGRAEDSAAELAELESMYADEEFATKTKELVLNRSRRDLELARRGLDLAERKRKQVEGYELPGKEHELEKSWISGQKGLLEAEQALEKMRLEHKIARTKAEMEVAELSQKLAKAQKKKGKGSDAGDDSDDDHEGDDDEASPSTEKAP